MTFPPGCRLLVRLLPQRAGGGVTLRNLKFELTGHTLSADFPGSEQRVHRGGR